MYTLETIEVLFNLLKKVQSNKEVQLVSKPYFKRYFLFKKNNKMLLLKQIQKFTQISNAI